MSQEGDQGVSQSGSIVQDMETMSPRSGKRCRDESEEGRHSIALGMDAQCVKAMDLNVSSDIVSSDGGGNGGEAQDNLALSQSEKRMRCGPSNVESDSQTPIPSSLTAEMDVVASDGGNNVSTGTASQNLSQDCAAAIAKVSDKAAEVHTFGIERHPQFHCDICLVKSTSAKDLETHLAGRRHAIKARELALRIGTSGCFNSSHNGSEAQVYTFQASTHLNSNMHTTSIGQQGPVDGSGEAFKGYIPGCTVGTNVGYTTTIGQQGLVDGSGEAFKGYIPGVTGGTNEVIGSIVQDMETMSPCSGKRCRDESEEGRHSIALGMDAQCVKAMDLNVSSDIVSSDGGGNGGEAQDNLALSQSEKRMRCGPSNVESDSQTPIPSSLTAEMDVVASDGGNNVGTGTASQNLSQDCAAAIAKVSDKAAEVHTFGIERRPQFHCDICLVKSTSAKDLETHLAGRRHAIKARELALRIGTSGCFNSSHNGSEAQVYTFQASTHLNSNMHTTSIGQQGPVDGSGEAFKGYIPGCTVGTNVGYTTTIGQQGLVDGSGEAFKGYIPGVTGGTNDEDFQASLSKCPDSSDPNAVPVGQQASVACPLSETLVNQGSKNDPPSKLDCNDGHNRYFCQPGTNGTFNNPTLTDGLLEKISSRILSEGEPFKNLMASLSTKSNSDCVARALASALSTYGCPGVGDPQKGGSCDQAAGCSDSQVEGAMSADSNGMVTDLQKGGSCDQAAGCLDSQVEGAISAVSNGMVTMHARCFANLLHEVQVCVMEDLVLYGGLKTNSWLPSAVPVSASAPQGEDLHCSVCRVEYGSKADLDLHLAGKKHASLVQRVYSRCQLCNLNCNTEKDFKTHLSGKRHASKLRLVQKRVTF